MVAGAARWLNDDENWRSVKLARRRILSVPVANAEERYAVERQAAELLSERPPVGIKGINLKQGRNVWQALGYTCWAIPFDSRNSKILDQEPFSFNFPRGERGGLVLRAKQYHDLEWRLMTICRQAETFPCLLDAAFFDMEEFAHGIIGMPRRRMR